MGATAACGWDDFIGQVKDIIIIITTTTTTVGEFSHLAAGGQIIFT